MTLFPLSSHVAKRLGTERRKTKGEQKELSV